MNKRKITAREMLTDLRSGLSDPALMQKYKLSSLGLQSVFQKMLKAGALTQAELDARVPMSERTVDVGLYICSACGNIQGREFTTCPRCGFEPPNSQTGAPEKGAEDKKSRRRGVLGRVRKQSKAVSAKPGSTSRASGDSAEEPIKDSYPDLGRVARYGRVVGIISIASYALLVVCLLVLAGLAMNEQFPSVTQLMVGLAAMGILATIMFFLLSVTSRAFAELSALLANLSESASKGRSLGLGQ